MARCLVALFLPSSRLERQVREVSLSSYMPRPARRP